MYAIRSYYEDPVFRFLGGNTSEWSDGFDAASTGAADVRTSTPILSLEIVNASYNFV